MARRNTVTLLALLLPLWWLAHALGYLVHEYAHSFTAWALGYKANPMALTYGRLTVPNVLLLFDIDENVNYGPIFADGKGYLASVIAVSGVLFGNGVFYFVARWLFFLAKEWRREALGLLAFLLCLMNVGNFFGYVPVRTFTTHADMATVERGLGISAWWVAIVLGIPFAIAISHFFSTLLPDACGFLFPDRRVAQVVLLVVSSATAFFFPFGASGLRGYGDVSHWISAVSSCVLFPAVVILCWRSSSSLRVSSLKDSAAGAPGLP